jgi:FOG: PKD repeat
MWVLLLITVLAAPVGAAWTIFSSPQEIAPGPISLTLDREGHPHFSYCDALWGGQLVYSKWNGTSWSSQIVDDNKRAWHYTSIALDSDDRPHISYFNLGDDFLNYTEWDGTAWILQTVDSHSNGVDGAGEFNSLRLDSHNRPHISYFDRVNQQLKYAEWNGTAWVIQIVDDNNSGGHTSLVLDANDNPHISYVDFRHNYLKYAEWNGTAWAIQTVDASSGHAATESTSLALDSLGNPHIAYYHIDRLGGPSDRKYTDLLEYAKRKDNAWILQTVDSGSSLFWGNTCPGPSLALDGNDNPHICYLTLEHRLKYARGNGTAWLTRTIDTSARGSYPPSLVLDPGGNPHIGYYDQAVDRLKYAWGNPVFATIAATPASGTVPLTVQFNGTPMDSSLSSWVWSFGDGDTSLQQNPSHTYSSPGTYNVTLTVYDGYGDSDMAIMTRYIAAAAPARTPPVPAPGYNGSGNGHQNVHHGSVREGTNSPGYTGPQPTAMGYQPAARPYEGTEPARSQKPGQGSPEQAEIPPTALEAVIPETGISPAFPIASVVLIGSGGLTLAGSAWYIRRWWIRHQNPALFRKYD